MASEIIITIHQISWFCRLQGNFKNLEIWYAECSWGDAKTIQPGIWSALGRDISEKYSIVYTSACIEEERNGRNISHTYSKYGSHSHTWNDEDNAFDYQLDQ